ncbi:hypothetical protein [Streptomyces litchfieldiae]|uniref:Uncharacterized protein n=1 Tax=Streptomyces litchfieldiae TaxID=3075543 RepID=A0ABU2N0N5_9ACTN|nr:hypothetical protein [Streptomyces sp. DSM 44938]MDT0347465.1 hypothetical protein [Streptomyces sp. DSM 44938]
MDTPIKGNAEIEADRPAFMVSYRRARAALGALDGVVSVGFGCKQRGGTFTDDIGIIVSVVEKKPEAELAPEQRVPPAFEGYRTDVRPLMRLIPGGCDNDTSYDTIQGGIQIQLKAGNPVGTLGCIVRRRGDSGRENVYLLSNKHVLYSGGAETGDYVYHPYAPGTPRPSAALGPTQALAFYQNVTVTVTLPSGTQVTDDFFIDCATARIDLDSKCFGSTCTKDVTKYDTVIADLQLGGGNRPTDVRNVVNDVAIIGTASAGPYVYKVGRTTGRTRGVVRSVNKGLHMLPRPELPGFPEVTGKNVIEIEFAPDPAQNPGGLNCHGHPYFAEPGDSGSIVVDNDGRVIGIITGVPDPSNPQSSTTAAACHIVPVLDKLGICVPTSGGTSHGSCGATDGSGQAPAPATTARDDAPATAPPPPPPEPRPVAVTEAERARLLRLREEFRRTEKGRELHETFAQVRREIGYLVRNSRRVKVAWYRNQGPAFLTHTLNHLRGRTDSVPLEVNGVSRTELLTRMAQVLAAHGSNPLRAAVERHRDDLLHILATATTAEEAVALFADLDPADDPAAA